MVMVEGGERWSAAFENGCTEAKVPEMEEMEVVVSSRINKPGLGAQSAEIEMEEVEM
jgi:hypothetical protein